MIEKLQSQGGEEHPELSFSSCECLEGEGLANAGEALEVDLSIFLFFRGFGVRILQ